MASIGSTAKSHIDFFNKLPQPFAHQEVVTQSETVELSYRE